MSIIMSDDWERFRYLVKTRSRYIFSETLLSGAEPCFKYLSSEQFLAEVMETLESSKRFIDLPQGTTLWRAQLGGTPYTPPPEGGIEFRSLLGPHGRKRMIPWADKAREGRINPKGIPCFYSATDPYIALSEMKPQIGAHLTLGEFVTTRNLRIVDFAADCIELADPDGFPTDEEMEAMVWEDVNDLFARPVNDTDDIADYAPTQILGELFRRRGYEGIRYTSKCNIFESLEPHGSPERNAQTGAVDCPKGTNVALFDITTAEFKCSSLHQFVISARGSFEFRPVRKDIFCSDQIPDLG